LIFSTSLTEHVKQVQQVLELLRQNSLFINQKKCSFGVKEVEYLGHIISVARVAVDPKKIEAMRSWPVPTDSKGLRGFLGITGYYRRFVKGYGSIAEPLTQLLRKDCFICGEEAQLAFDKLKEALTTLPVSAVPNFDKPFTIEIDASRRGLGVV